MSLILKSINCGINFVNIALHGLGVIFLTTLYKNGDKSFQQLYLLNLASSQFLKHILGAAHVLTTIGTNDYVPDKSALWVALWTGVNYNVICAMFYITGDRLLQVCFNLKYSKVYWSLKRTKRLIIITWIINVMISVGFSVSHVVAANLKPGPGVSYLKENVSFTYLNYSDTQRTLKNNDEHFAIPKNHIGAMNNSLYAPRNVSNTVYWIDRLKHVAKIFDTFIPPSLQVTYLIFATVTYLVMFSKYVQSKQKFQHSDSSVSTLFIRSRFFIPVLLITSYLLFTVIPTTIIIIWWWKAKNRADNAFRLFVTCTKTSVRLSCTVQAVIYLFLKPEVRKLLLRTVRRSGRIYSNKNNDNVESPVKMQTKCSNSCETQWGDS